MAIATNTSAADRELIGRIIERAKREFRADFKQMKIRQRRDMYLTLTMDLHACHEREPLNLQKLLDFPPYDFMHDVAGIHRHVDRRPGHEGELRDGFWPRCGARPSHA